MKVNITEEKFINLLIYLYKQIICLQYPEATKQVKNPRFKEVLLRCGFTEEEATLLDLEIWVKVWKKGEYE